MCKQVSHLFESMQLSNESRERGRSYILVHQAGLADTAVTEDNDLPTSAGYTIAARERDYLEEDFLPRRHCVCREGG